MPGSNSGNLPASPRASKPDETAFLAINIINGFLEMILKLLPLMTNVDAESTIILASTVISFIYISASKVIIHIPNTSYFRTIEPICYLSGVLVCGLLLLIISPPFGWFLLCSSCTFLLIKVFKNSCPKAFELLRGRLIGVLNVLINSPQRIFNRLNQETVSQSFNDNSMAQEDSEDASTTV